VEGTTAGPLALALSAWQSSQWNWPDIRLLWSSDERIKEQLQLGHAYKEVSKYPPVLRDISFVVAKSFVPNNYFDLVRDIGGDLIEQVGADRQVRER